MLLVSLPAASDYHIHLRSGKTLSEQASFVSDRCGRILVMPNDPTVLTASDMLRYKREIHKHIEEDVDVLMTVKITAETTPETIKEAFQAGAIAAKIYPLGTTTGSSDGLPPEVFQVEYLGEDGTPMRYPRLIYLKKAKQLLDVLGEMEKLGMVLCLHPEMPGVEVMEREIRFLDFVGFLIQAFPELRIVVEHITTHEAVSSIRAWQYANIGKPCRVAATITPHHLYLTLDDVIGGKIRPWNFCNPVAKEKMDLEFLRQAAFSGERWFFLGSDNAPQHRKSKECEEGCAGIFNAPVMIESLIELFEDNNALERLPNFISGFGDQFYQLKQVTSRPRKYVKKNWVVPEEINGMKPFLSGKTMKWKLR